MSQKQQSAKARSYSFFCFSGRQTAYGPKTLSHITAIIREKVFSPEGAHSISTTLP
ncbi:MAG: hypothetical protein WCZ43_02475 [Proteiniphilum sp.]